jgi:hypothetical protein
VLQAQINSYIECLNCIGQVATCCSRHTIFLFYSHVLQGKFQTGGGLEKFRFIYELSAGNLDLPTDIVVENVFEVESAMS